MAHIIQNEMSVRSNTITLQTAGTFADQDVVITNTVNAGSFTNSPVNDQTYTEDTSTNTVLPSGGYLYINKGWHDNVKIALGHMIPEIADTDAGDNHILFGYKAYDENGRVITGTMSTVNPTFSGGGVTATASGSVTLAPKVTVTQSFSSAASTTYGFTTTRPSGSEGTNYLKIDAGGTATDGSVTATANASSSNVVFAQAVKGFLDKAANATALAGQTAQAATASISVTPTVVDNAAAMYVPIITPTFGGGTISGSASVSITKPKITLSSSASTGASTYGVTTTAPTTGEYVTISTTVDPTRGTATPSGSATRGAVTITNSAGAIKANTKANALAASSATTLTGTASNIDIDITDDNLKSHYIPVVTPTFAGGGVTGSASVTVTQPSVTVSTSMSTGAADYGVTTTEPTSGEYISIIASNSTIAGKATPSGSASRGAVTFTNSAGVIKASSGATALTASDATTLSGTAKDIIPTVTSTNFKSHYIPKATIKAVPGAPSITKPTATASVALATNGGENVSGVLTSAPTGNYIKITPGVSTTAGSATSTASAAANSAGVISASTTGGTVSGTAATVSVTNNTPASATRYIKMYDGSYTIS